MSHQLSHAGGPQDVRGVEALKIFVREFRQAFPDSYDIIEDQGAEADEVVTRFTSVGTHRGPLMGVEPTNKQVRWSGIAIDRVVGGKIAEEWVSWDMMGMLQQIGAVSWPS